MIHTSASSYETLLTDALQHGENTNSIFEAYIVEHIREVRNVHDTVRAEWRTDGRDVLDLLSNYDDVTITPEEKKNTCYSNTNFYIINIGALQLRFGTNNRQGEECHAVELFFGQQYIFNALFMLPEDIADTIIESAEKYPKWTRQWSKMLIKCQKQAKLKTLGEMAIVSYLNNKIGNRDIQYTLTDHKNSLDIYLKINCKQKIKINVPYIGFQSIIDEVVEQVFTTNEALQKLSDYGKIMRDND